MQDSYEMLCSIHMHSGDVLVRQLELSEDADERETVDRLRGPLRGDKNVRLAREGKK
jgi:hypothetical protein